MSSVLKKADMEHYNNDDHLAFHKSSCGIFVKYALVINAPELIAEYESAVTKEKVSFSWIRKNELTEKKAAADNRRDNTFVGMTVIVRANFRHFDPPVRDAAVHVCNMIENYGSIVKKDYEAKTIIFDNIIEQLRSHDYSLAVQLLNLRPWIDRLEIDNNEFKTCVSESVALQLGKPSVNLKTARKISDKDQRAVINHVTALVSLNGQDQYVDFAAEYNELVSHYNTIVKEHYGRLHAKIDIAQAVIDPIAEQPFTGKPVIVIPTVHIRRTVKEKVEETEKTVEKIETVELFFSEDFTVLYRNNIRHGTAKLTIKGIGKYKGAAVTTFNIV
jgi:hypothetical protein